MSEPVEPKKPDWEHTQWHLNPPDKGPTLLGRVTITIVATVIGAIALGVTVAAWPYIDYFFLNHKPSTAQYQRAKEAVEHDTHAAVHTRFFIGAGTGAVLGCTIALLAGAKEKSKPDPTP